MGKSLNINDVARLAGVSRSTVSRVLMNSGKVKPETARKIRKAMQAANYRPNILARGLVTGKLNIIAMLMADPNNPFLLQMVGELDQEFRDRGYILSICCLGKGEQARCENFRAIQQYGFAGFIIGDMRNEASFIDTVRETSRPLVFFNRYIETLPDFDSIVVDNYLGGYRAAKHLLELGHRRIGVLTGPLEESSASRDRFRGFRDAVAEAGLELPTELVGHGDLTLDSGSDYARRVLRGGTPPCTAVFAGNDLMGIGILNYCREYGIRVPENLSLIGFDDIALSQSALINLSTIRQPCAEMSRVIAERILARIDGDERSSQRVMLEPKLVVRRTTAPLAGG